MIARRHQSLATRVQRRSGGFTLLEILVAMTVLTLLVTAAFGALRLGERSWELGLDHTRETENLRAVSGLLQRLFSQSMPVSWTEKTETTIAFSGDQQQLRFIAPAPRHGGATGLFEYTLWLDRRTADNRLLLYYQLHDPDTPGFAEIDEETQQVVLIENLGAAQFRYFGATASDEPRQWHGAWTSDMEMYPAMVRIELESNEQQVAWPELNLPLFAQPGKRT